MMNEERIVVLEKTITELRAKLVAQDALLARALMLATDVGQNREMLNEIQQRIWPFFANGAERNHALNEWLKSQVP